MSGIEAVTLFACTSSLSETSSGFVWLGSWFGSRGAILSWALSHVVFVFVSKAHKMGGQWVVRVIAAGALPYAGSPAKVLAQIASGSMVAPSSGLLS